MTRHHVIAPLRAPVTIAHLSDLHTGGLGRRERALLAILARERPDLIVLTGDMVDDVGFTAPRAGVRDDEAYARAAPLLRRLRAPLGVFAVRGNWENWRRASDEPAFYPSVGVRLLVNEGWAARDDLWLAGLDDPWSGSPEIGPALADAPAASFKVALFHSPVCFESTAGRVDLALAGHTHGGQVRLPLAKPFWLPHGSGRYLAGWYEQAGSRLFVSRGVGTSTLPVRFNCRPEVALITLGPGPSASE